jgi:Uma2 family endonuclease
MSTEQVVDDVLVMTEEEYLAFEEAAEEKHEFVDGYVYALHGPIALSGATIGHNRLQMRSLDQLRRAAARVGCEAFGSDVRLRIRSPITRRYYYPDAIVVCDERDRDDPESLWVEHPLIVVEVTSRRTARVDREAKLDAYLALDSLRVYLIVSQREQRVDCYWRDDGLAVWQHQTYMDGDIPLAALGASLSVPALYGVE